MHVEGLFKKYKYIYINIYICLKPILGWFDVSPQAVQDPAAGLKVLPGELGTGVLQCEGARGRPPPPGAPVRWRQLHAQEMLFTQDCRWNT